MCLCMCKFTVPLLYCSLTNKIHTYIHVRIILCLKSVSVIMYEPLVEFHQIYNLGTVGDKDKLISSELTRSKVKVTTISNTVKNYLFKNAIFQ